MRTRIGILLALAAAVGAWGQDDPQPDPEALKAVREAFEAGSSAAQARVREAKTAIAAELREDSERDARFDQALKDLTKRSPLRLKLSDTLTLDQVRVTGYYAGRVTLAWPQGEVEYPLELLPEETRATLVGAALTKAGPRDHFEMGKLLVRGKDFERAARCFDTAQRDPALAPFIPDLERLKRSARLFEGSFRTAGNTLSLRWGFSSAAEAGDFAAIQGSVGVRPGQGLEVDGEKIAVAAVKEIPFRNRIRVSALPKESDAVAHLMGIRFSKPDGGDVLIYGALATAAKTFLVTKVEDGKAQELQAPTPGAAGNRMTMEFNRGRVVFQVGDRSVWSGNEGGFTDVLVVLGCVALPKPGAVSRASGVFRDLSLQGEVNPAWMTKKMSGLRSAMASELSKEHRAKRTEGAAGTLTLSVDPVLARVPAEVRDAYKAALAKVTTMRQSRLQEDFDAARLAMDQLSGANPTFAPSWYWRGLLAEMDGNLRAASGYFDRALALLPDFPEALCARGRIRVLEGKWDPARESVERALALKPDLAEGHLLRARLQWEKRESGAVIDSTELARRLAPLDPDIDSDAKMLANVARGPRWPKPNSHATAHYAVRSDLPAAKCRLYAEHLEAIRPHYAEVLGRAGPEGKPAEVLIFESEEGYFIYNDYTVGSRGEHTLGAFSPWHGQMALFEGLEAADTLNVLSHEGFHQYLHGLAPDVPIWFNEGMAEYVGAARVENGKIVERGGIQSGRLDNLKLAVKYGWRPLPFDKIMLESQAEFYGPQAPFKYAQAWSMIRYFKDGDSGRWSGVLKAYTDRLLAGDSALAAFEASFAKEDLKALEAAWMKHYGLVLTVRPAGKASAPPAPTPVDLLALIGATRPQGQGWTLKDGALNSAPVQPGGAIDLGYVPPEEYEWRLTLTRFYGQGGLALGLQGGGKTFVVKLDDWGVGSGLEAVDGAAGRNPTFVRGRRLLLPGQTASVVCTVRRTGVGVTLNDEVVLDWKGDLGRLSYAPGPGMPAATKNLFLGAFGDHFKVSAMSVKAVSSDPTAPAVTPSAPTIKVDRARAIALDCDIVQWIVDEDSRQILALDPSGKLLQVSMAEMKVLRKISVGSDAVALCAAPGNAKAVWVSSKKGQNLLKVDLEKGDVADAIPVPVPPGAVLGIRKYLFYMDTELPGVCAVDTSDKKDLGRLTGEAFFAMAYEPRKDRLWVTAGGSLVEYDGSKIGAVLRELSRKNLGAKERQDLTAELSPGLNNKGTITKRHFVTGTDGRTTWSRVQWDEKGGRLYFGTFAAKSDKPETPLGSYVAKPHSLEKDPAIAQFIAKARPTEQILAVSPDGKWVATGAHLFGAASFQVSRELPLPTSLVAFSKDSKEVCYYDWVNRVIAVMDVEAK